MSDSSPEISIGDREYRATEDEQLIIDPGSGDNTLIERDDNGYEIVSYEVVSTKNGDAEFIGTRFYYQASSNYNGVDEVTYRVTNEYGYEGVIETLTINVAEVNDIPEISGSPATAIDEGS